MKGSRMTSYGPWLWGSPLTIQYGGGQYLHLRTASIDLNDLQSSLGPTQKRVEGAAQPDLMKAAALIIRKNIRELPDDAIFCFQAISRSSVLQKPALFHIPTNQHQCTMVDAGQDWLEAILLKKAFAESPIRVLDLTTSDTSAVVTKGDNYMSKLRRLKARVLLGSGKVENLSLIVKNQHETEAMKKFSTDLGIFHREITMYRDILVKMEDLLGEIGDSEGTFWPKCYDIRLYDRLIFEDLGKSGYKMADRKNQQSLDSALLVVRHLAKFHALARILLDRGEVPQEPFAKSVYRVDERMFVTLNNENVRRFTQMMETRWGEDWNEAADRIKKFDAIGDVYLKSADPQPDEFTTLCHGDCWTNNMMFKGEDSQRPTSMKFVDFQLSYITSPARDLVYFLSTSVKLDVRIKNIELLLQTYCNTLKSYLTKFSYEGPIPEINDIKKSLKKRSILPLCDAIALVPVILGNHENAPDMEEVASKEFKALENGEGSPEVWNIFEELSPAAEAILKYEVKNAMEHGII